MSKTAKSTNNKSNAEEYVELTLDPIKMLIGVVAIIAIFFIFTKNPTVKEKSASDSNNAKQAEDSSKKDMIKPDTFELTANISDSPVLGDENAPVTIVEFSDLECPYCRAFYFGISGRIEPAWPKIKENFIDKGKVKYVSKSFVAVPSHNPAAKIEAQGTYCAGKQGRYYEYMHELFDIAGNAGAGANNAYSKGGESKLKEELVALAKKLKLDVNKFKACLNSSESTRWFDRDNKYVKDVIIPAVTKAGREGVGTPLFIICKSPKEGSFECKGKVLMGAYPYGYFETLINDLLDSNK